MENKVDYDNEEKPIVNVLYYLVEPKKELAIRWELQTNRFHYMRGMAVHEGYMMIMKRNAHDENETS